jgi:hypothetical protein
MTRVKGIMYYKLLTSAHFTLFTVFLSFTDVFTDIFMMITIAQICMVFYIYYLIANKVDGRRSLFD